MSMLAGPVRAQQPHSSSTAQLTPFGTGLTGVTVSASSVGDVNGDGNLDLVITGFDSEGMPATRLYLGTGNGGFTPTGAGLLPIVHGPSSSFGDVNNDGDLDLVITGDSNTGQLAALIPSTTLYLGDGQGAFTEAEADLTGVDGVGTSSSFGDVNDDGNVDLVLTGWNGSPRVILYLGNGAGGFVEAEAGLDGVGQGASSLGDVNNDGNLDLLVVGWSGTPSATLYLGDGEGGFTKADVDLLGVGIPPIDTATSSSAFGHVNNDGNLDLVITGRDSSDTPTARLYRGDGEGDFIDAEAGLLGVENGSSSFGDVDGDGHLDLVLTGGDSTGTPTATLYWGDGTGGFTDAEAGLTGVVASSSAFGDVDNDGHLDFLITGADSGGTRTAILYENLAAGNRQVAADSSTVDASGTVDFGATGVRVRFDEVSGSGTVRVRKFDNRPSNARGIAEANVSTDRFVLSAGGDLTFGSGTEVRFDLDMLAGIGDPTNVTVYRRSVAGNGRFTALPTAVDADGRLVATTGAFSEFVLASDTEPLPVELTSFRAARDKNGAIRLAWTTASETNNAGFQVQRRPVEASDGRPREPWQAVGWVDGAGTTSEPQTYRFTDPTVPFAAERVHYRLRQIDTDGTAHLSETVTVALETPEQLGLHAPFPNPARSQATIRYELPRATDVQIAVYDVLGRRVATLTDGRTDAGRHQIQIKSIQLPSGTYFVRLTAGEHTVSRRLTVVR